VKSKVLKEWRAARFALHNKNKVEMMTDNNDDIIDTQNIEAEIDEEIMKAYKKVVGEMQEEGKLTK